MLSFITQRRRAKLASVPFPSAWREIIENRLPLFHRLPECDQRELERHVQVFLAEKNFEGCGGLEVTDEMRVAVAAQACVLLLHRETDYYPGLHSILIYPDTFFVQTEESRAPGVIDEGEVARLGEAWQQGALVLAWSSVTGGAAILDDGQNLVFHEFAHLLDFEDGHTDGAPDLDAGLTFLEGRRRYAAWGRVLGAEFKQLQAEADAGQETVLDHYGATNPAEFFAVATECFFEKPHLLKEKHADLYEELKKFYCQDPVRWGAGRG
jgi:Mlc titration factor MtfA (ptsG expression regulator)